MKRKLNCILLIDDDETTNYVNRILIERAECAQQVKSVTSGQDALDYLTSTDNEDNHPQPELIFLDINMPVMNGWEFIEDYNKLIPEHRGKVLVFMLSTSNNPEDKARAVSLGSDGFMAKPLTAPKLHELIDHYF